MPRISVVVPVYNVEPYLEECLESIAGQTFEDLEVVMVDDGSPDNSAAIAQRFVDRDPRFKLVAQPNAGLGAARNTGTEHATGEYIAFVDSDDWLAPNAYELLVGALEETGSDFATGNVLRVTPTRTRRAFFLQRAFTRTRLATHVKEFRPLIADRVAWNKLWRRSFWDANGYRFPEGVLNEDIPVTIPAHFTAKSVDVIADPIYYWRLRAGEELSITQRRLEPKALLDRLRAVRSVTDFLATQGGDWRDKYLESVVADDLILYLNNLDRADEGYRELFLHEVNAYLDAASDKIYARLPAIDRLKWHLVRRRLMPELIEVLRFFREDLADTPPLRIKGRWYGDYPFRTDERLGIPLAVYRLDTELQLRTEIEALEWDGEHLHVHGHSYISGIGAPTEDGHRLSVTALRPGRLKRLRLYLAGIRLKTEKVHRPDLTATSRQSLADVSWAGFHAKLDPRRLRRRGRLQPGLWELYVTVRVGRVGRRRARFTLSQLRPPRPIELPAADGVLARVVTTGTGAVLIDVQDQWVEVRESSVNGDKLDLTGELHGEAGAKPALEVVRRSDETTFKYKLKPDEAGGYRARIKLADLLGAVQVADEEDADGDEDEDPEDEARDDAESEDEADEAALEERIAWDVRQVSGGAVRPVWLPEDQMGQLWQGNGRVLRLGRTRRADAVIVESGPRATATRIAWEDDGVLAVAGELPDGVAPSELVLSADEEAEPVAFPLEVLPGGRFTARLTPAAVETLAGPLPLRAGRWDLFARTPERDVPVVIGRELYERIPMTAVVDHKPFTVALGRGDQVTIQVQRDLPDDERGPYHQRRMRTGLYPRARGEQLREAVVYSSFNGRQYSDGPRAIHEELVARGAVLEHLWVVRDGMCNVPATATALREGSREYYEAVARARYVVGNDNYPGWFERRADQVSVQTWHGVPLGPVGLDLPRRTPASRTPADQGRHWSYFVSPNRFATPILQNAYAVEGEMIETGYPRADVLARSDREAAAASLRARLGLPEGKRVVLYAPTYRDRVRDARGRHRLDLRLDLDRMRAALGDGSVLLFRKHHYVIDPVPADSGGFVRDVSKYPDGVELLLAADVLVTDYSPLMFDFANTGRPMLFFTYDIDSYPRDLHSFYFDYAETVPGPLLRTSDELTAALQDIGAVQAEHSARYADFAARFCELDDGGATARVVDRIFGG